MSWRGFKKAIERLPHTITSKTTERDINVNSSLKLTEQLETNLKDFKSQVADFMKHSQDVIKTQQKIFELIGDCYSPEFGSSKQQSGTDLTGDCIKMNESISLAVEEMSIEITPMIDEIDLRVLKKLEQASTYFKNTKNLATKRKHKLIDVDRHQKSVNKYRASGNDVEMLKYERLLEEAKGQYELINQQCTCDLPEFNDKMKYFMRMTLDLYCCLYMGVIDMFHKHAYNIMNRSGIDYSVDTSHYAKDFIGAFDKVLSANVLVSNKTLSANASSNNSVYENSSHHKISKSDTSVNASTSYNRPVSKTSSSSLHSLKNSYKNETSVIVIAMYDYEAQQEGDLTFREGDRIKVIQKTDEVDDWWTGELHGKVGLFPANYVQVLGRN